VSKQKNIYKNCHHKPAIYIAIVLTTLFALLLQPLLLQLLLPQAYFAHSRAFAAPAAQPATCSTANNDVGGIIFRDFNASGIQDALELGVLPADSVNMVVYAYDETNTVVATAAISDDGTYSFPALLATYPNVRLELGGVPSYLQPGASGPNNGTSNIRVDAATCTADVGLNRPADFCGPDPSICR